MSKLTREEKTLAIKRVQADGQVELEELAKLVRVSETRLRRFIAQGYGGAHLDGVVRAGEWFSSVPAWDRFVALRPELERRGRSASTRSGRR